MFVAFSIFASSMIMIHGYCSWNVFYDSFKCLRFLKGCFNAILQFPSHLQGNLEKKTLAHQTVFFKIMDKLFFKTICFCDSIQE